MKITKTVEVPARKETRLDHLQCELCGKITHRENNWQDSQGAGSTYAVCETSVSLRRGASYPEGGNIEELIVDICDTCFETKLVPWIESQGGSARTEESDW